MPRKPNTACIICSTQIYRKPYELKRSGGKAFCGQECYGKFCRKNKKCVICSTQILSKLHKKTCSKKCQELNNKRPDRLHARGRQVSITDYRSRSFRKKFRLDRKNKCQACGYSNISNLPIHHMIERKDGGSDKEENLLLLCPNCHIEIHEEIEGKALDLQKEKLGNMTER